MKKVEGQVPDGLPQRGAARGTDPVTSCAMMLLLRSCSPSCSPANSQIRQLHAAPPLACLKVLGHGCASHLAALLIRLRQVSSLGITWGWGWRGRGRSPAQPCVNASSRYGEESAAAALKLQLSPAERHRWRCSRSLDVNTSMRLRMKPGRSLRHDEEGMWTTARGQAR